MGKATLTPGMAKLQAGGELPAVTAPPTSATHPVGSGTPLSSQPSRGTSSGAFSTRPWGDGSLLPVVCTNRSVDNI